MIPDEKFRKKEHLLKSKDFFKVYKKGISYKAGGVILYVLANALGHNRLGFSIGSKAIKRSTVRNRIRRLFREAYRKNKGALKAGFDMVIVARKMPENITTYVSAEDVLLKLTAGTRLKT
ncbi:MAG: ribonuclease P protein component [Candidatus Omnitrophica bacterium]|jgi:ribonuclease P protein component|nr:ribonuclease P protein component [Candidatus Omnitrophota bacterium]